MPVLPSAEIYPSKTTSPTFLHRFLLFTLHSSLTSPSYLIVSAHTSPLIPSLPHPLFFTRFSVGPRWRIKMSGRSNTNIHHRRALRAYTQKATQRLTCLARVVNTESAGERLGNGVLQLPEVLFWSLRVSRSAGDQRQSRKNTC